MSAATQAKEQAAWMRRYYGQLRAQLAEREGREA